MTMTKLDINSLIKHLTAARDELDILSGNITLDGETTADSLAEHLDAAIREGKQQTVQLEQMQAQVRELLEERDCYWGGQRVITQMQHNETEDPALCSKNAENENNAGGEQADGVLWSISSAGWAALREMSQ